MIMKSGIKHRENFIKFEIQIHLKPLSQTQIHKTHTHTPGALLFDFIINVTKIELATEIFLRVL